MFNYQLLIICNKISADGNCSGVNGNIIVLFKVFVSALGLYSKADVMLCYSLKLLKRLPLDWIR